MLGTGDFFTAFEESMEDFLLPEYFSYLAEHQPHPLCILASEKLQEHLINQKEWEHNFGLEENVTGTVIGKMFGVLVVKTSQNEIGYLAAFSGKLAGGNHHSKFVPPIYDALKEGSLLNIGMTELTQVNLEIKELMDSGNTARINELKQYRKEKSARLQDRLFDEYNFLNYEGVKKSLRSIFSTVLNQAPPSGAGECAAPKLLQYAFQHKMKPLALAEFWWGLSPKSNFWKHGKFYPVCREKCQPILSHMLEGLDVDSPLGS